MSGYHVVLASHSALRWAVLALCLLLIARSSVGWRRGRPWTRIDESLHVALVAVMDLQVLLGLALYFVLSPLTHAFLAEPADAMRHPALRFFGFEHLLAMLIALAIVHASRVASRRAVEAARHRRVLIATVALLIVLLAGIPWPFEAFGRPLVRLPSMLV